MGQLFNRKEFIIKKTNILGLLGSGAQGMIYKVKIKARPDKIFAMKVIHFMHED